MKHPEKPKHFPAEKAYEWQYGEISDEYFAELREQYAPHLENCEDCRELLSDCHILRRVRLIRFREMFPKK